MISLILVLSFLVVFSSNSTMTPPTEINAHPESAPQPPQQNYNYSAILQQIMDLLPAVSSSNSSLYYWINLTFIRDKLSTALQQLGYNLTFMDLYEKYYDNVSYQVGISPRQKTLSASLALGYVAPALYVGPGSYNNTYLLAGISKAWVFFFNFSNTSPSFTLSGPFTNINFAWPGGPAAQSPSIVYEEVAIIAIALTIVTIVAFLTRMAFHKGK